MLHRWSDVAAAGDGDSPARAGAGLLRECETAWLFRQPPDEAREMAVALGLSTLEERYLLALPKGAPSCATGRIDRSCECMPRRARLRLHRHRCRDEERGRWMTDRPVLGRRASGFHVWREQFAGGARLPLVVGPTQSGKTSSLVVRRCFDWSGAVVVTSVKSDVVGGDQAVAGTRQRASPRAGPGRRTDVEPPRGRAYLSSRPSRGTRHDDEHRRSDTDFWNSLATKLVAAFMIFALENSSDIFDVAWPWKGERSINGSRSGYKRGRRSRRASSNTNPARSMAC